MVIDGNELLQQDSQPETGSSSDAYEVYWSSTEDDRQAERKGSLFPSSDALQPCRPGDAYNELWQHWDAQ